MTTFSSHGRMGRCRVVALTVAAVSLVAAVLASVPGLVGGQAGAEQAGSAVRRVAAGSVDVGWGHTCVVSPHLAVRCWGNGRTGKLGHNSTSSIGNGRGKSIKQAGKVPVGRSVTAIAAGTGHTCALLTSGAVRCWGTNKFGQLGYNNTTRVGNGIGPSIKAAGNVPLGGTATAITAGWYHTCALMVTGAVRCWGDGMNGALGHDSQENIGDGLGADLSIKAAGDVPLGGKAVAISAGVLDTCALLDTGAVRCWGRNDSGELGYDSTVSVGDGIGPSITAVGNVPLGGKAVAISAGADHTCALMASGAVRCWGRGDDGRLGHNTTQNIADGVAGHQSIRDAGDVPLGEKAIAITSGLYHTCAVLTTHAVRCWGAGNRGQLGHNHTQNIGDGTGKTIRQAGNIPLGGKAIAIAAGLNHTCATLTTGAVRCWGAGGRGQLGHNNRADIGDGIGKSIKQAGNVPVGTRTRTTAH